MEPFRQRPKVHSKQGLFGFQVHNIVGLSPLTQGCQSPTSIFTNLRLGDPQLHLNLRHYENLGFLGSFSPGKVTWQWKTPLLEDVYFSPKNAGIFQCHVSFSQGEPCLDPGVSAVELFFVQKKVRNGAGREIQHHG